MFKLFQFLQAIDNFLVNLFPPAKYDLPPESLPMNTPIDVPPREPVAPKYLWDNPANVRHSIRVIGDEFGFSPHMKDLLCDIARCESGFVINAKLVNSPTSIDRGLYQWNNLYHPEITDAIAYDPEQNTLLACRALRAGKSTLYWSASKPCWNAGGKYNDVS